MKVKSLSRVRLLATPSTAAYQALPSMGFSRQEYWSGVPLPSLRYKGLELRMEVRTIYIYTYMGREREREKENSNLTEII